MTVKWNNVSFTVYQEQVYSTKNKNKHVKLTWVSVKCWFYEVFYFNPSRFGIVFTVSVIKEAKSSFHMLVLLFTELQILKYIRG
jgi:hypothetical protein